MSSRRYSALDALFSSSLEVNIAIPPLIIGSTDWWNFNDLVQNANYCTLWSHA
jgi:hypothetical protein